MLHCFEIDATGYLRIAICLGFLTTGATATWQTFCTEDWEFVYSAVYQTHHELAATTCGNIGYFLAKVDTLSLAQEIKEKGPRLPGFRVGAKNCANDRFEYCWLDGTNVSVDFKITYQQKTVHRCFQYKRNDLRTLPSLITIGCNSMESYLCQRHKSLPIVSVTNLTIIDASTQSVSCETGYCSPKWILANGTDVLKNGNARFGVWQDGTGTVSNLRFGNAADDDSGIYYCRTSRNQSTYKAVEVRVQGKPNMTIVKSLCSSNVTVVWIPGKYALDYPHTISLTDGQTLEVTPTTNKEQSFTISTLLPSTEYTLNITSCKGDCTLNFLPPSKTFTTNGTPNKVENVSSRLESNLKCNVSWIAPRRATVEGISYKIRVVEASVVFRPLSPHRQEWENETDLLHFEYKIKSNMNYTITIEARNCGGTSEEVVIAADCNSLPSAPDNVPAPRMIATKNTSMPDVRLTVPDESTGLLSCLLVMISDGTSQDRLISNDTTLSYSVEEFRSTLSSRSESNEYLAIAISPNEFVNSTGDVRFAVGNASKSACNLTDSSSAPSPMNNDCNEGIICATNKPLQKLASYKAYVVAVVYVNNTLSVKASTFANFEIRDPAIPGIDTSVILAASLGAATFILLLGLGILIVVKKNRGKDSYLSTNNGTTTKNGNSIYEIPLPIIKNAPDPSPPLQKIMEYDQPTTPSKQTVEAAVQDRVSLLIIPDDSIQLYENCVITNRKTDIRLEELISVYTTNRQKNNTGFYQQYQEIVKESLLRGYSTLFASDPLLKSKNRYKNILPYDSSRVVLEGTPTGYINACYVDGFSAKNKFIATQGPLPKTLGDFWLMIYEQRCSIIVMLTKPVESGKKKCETYWPNKGHSLSFDTISVQTIQENLHGGYICRYFEITDGEHAVHTTQYHFLNWPDHGAPQVTSNLVHMHGSIMREFHQNSYLAPIVVHCSAGAGRTGTFIGYDILLEQSAKHGSVDFYSCVMKMREQRVDMVQNTSQYTFLHKLILESYVHGDTDLTTDEFQQMYRDLSSKKAQNELKRQFGTIGRVTPMKDELFEIGGADYVDIKETPKTYVYSSARVVLTEDDDEPPVIDASWIQTEDASLPMIAASIPTKSKLDLFWRAVMDNNVGTIVSLSSPAQDGSQNYYPESTEAPMPINNGLVTAMNCSEEQHATKRIFEVDITGRKSLVTLLQCESWTGILHLDENHIVSLINLMKKTAQQAHKNVILVHCSDGVSRTGIFCTIVNLLDRIRAENRIDIPRTVKDLKDSRPMMVKNQEQYNLCYKILQQHLDLAERYPGE